MPSIRSRPPGGRDRFTNPITLRLAVLLVAAAALNAGCTGSSSESSDPPTPVAESVELGAPSHDFHGFESASTSKNLDATADQAPDAATPSGPREKQFPGIRFTIPGDWREQKLSNALSIVINSKYTIPHPKGNMELTMTTMGGGADGNIQRWVGQMQLDPGETPRYESVDINSETSKWVDVRGTYTSRVDQRKGPFPHWRLVGVVIPNKPKDFILKLIGPREAVADIYDEFKRVVKTARFDR